MINITEDTPKKLSGITSLFVNFTFNIEVVNVLKTCDKYVYDASSKNWEVPVTSLAYLLDELTYYDDITLKILKEKDKEIYYPKLINKYKTTPFKHQIEGIQWGLNLDNGGLLLDDPGLGKSLQMIYLAEELKEQKGLEHCLIICGINTLKRNWKQEIEKHSNLTCRIIGEKISKKGKISSASITERAKEIKEPLDAFFYILNIESLRYKEVVEAIKKSKNKIDLIVFDECHKCFEYDTLIKTNVGELKIGDIVENKLNCSVKCFNHKTKKFEWQPIINYFKSQSSLLLELTIKDETGKLHIIRCTPEHKIFTKNRGYIMAKNLKDTDDIVLDLTL